MRNKSFIVFIVTAFLFLGCKDEPASTDINKSYIPENPNQKVVFDSSDLFTTVEEQILSEKIIRYEQTSTNQAAVLSIDSIPSKMEIQQFGKAVANAWGIGLKDKDNGLLITISKFEKKIAISTGLGTEQLISDDDCQRIIDNLMIPQFKRNNYFEGVERALDSLFILWD
ncbi:TPM domain-containing protein [Winogradskyella tangerina]|uniref:TPM domain-containing protein n=1 Tax=Winogradskyella tangerina TaxID=2023240 RepID=UPI000DBE5915|nr:TPM domain-containing protein [Winogradskyella tangerina]